MNKTEIIEVVFEVMTKLGLRKIDVARNSGVGDSNISRFFANDTNPRFDMVFQIIDSLDLQLVLEDKDAEWGPEMARLRMMPKKLYVGERIESREIVRKQGFYPRVDLFDNIESALKFMPKPLDVYEIRVNHLIRKKFDLIDHPFGTMYSYNEWIPPESILHMVTHR